MIISFDFVVLIFRWLVASGMTHFDALWTVARWYLLP